MLRKKVKTGKGVASHFGVQRESLAFTPATAKFQMELVPQTLHVMDKWCVGVLVRF